MSKGKVTAELPQTAVVAKVILNVAGKEIELTLEQAKELHEVLGNLMGQPDKVMSPVWPWQPVWYVYPYWQYGNWTVTRGSSGGINAGQTWGNYTVSLLPGGGANWSQE